MQNSLLEAYAKPVFTLFSQQPCKLVPITHIDQIRQLEFRKPSEITQEEILELDLEPLYSDIVQADILFLPIFLKSESGNILSVSRVLIFTFKKSSRSLGSPGHSCGWLVFNETFLQQGIHELLNSILSAPLNSVNINLVQINTNMLLGLGTRFWDK